MELVVIQVMEVDKEEIKQGKVGFQVDKVLADTKGMVEDIMGVMAAVEVVEVQQVQVLLMVLLELVVV